MSHNRDALAQRVLMAAEHFVEAHVAWAETQPWRRKPCLRRNAAGETCFSQAMEELRKAQQETGHETAISPEEVEDWCPNCQHNWRMAQKRGERANARTGAMRWLVRAVRQWQDERLQGLREGGQ